MLVTCDVGRSRATPRPAAEPAAEPVDPRRVGNRTRRPCVVEGIDARPKYPISGEPGLLSWGPTPPAPAVTRRASELRVVEGPARDAEFDELYRTEHLPMVRLGYLLTGNRDAAAEIVHDAFLRTYERWDRVDNPGGYLRTVVVNRCNDHHRRRIRRATDPVAELDDQAVHDPDDVLADVIARLKPKRRAAIVLRYHLDLSQAEIAQAMVVRQGTVKSLLHRGLADLRALLDDHGPPPPPSSSDPAATPTRTPNDRTED